MHFEIETACMYFNVLIFIAGIGLVQGILIVVALLSQRKIHAFHIFLNTYIAAMLLQLVFKLASKLWLMQTWLQAYFLSYFIPFLYGPLIFLFAVSYLNADFKWKWTYVLHFIPFLVYASFYALADPEAYTPVIMLFLVHPVTRFILQLISLAVYHVFVFRMSRRSIDKSGTGKFFQLRTAFLKKFAGISLLITVCIVITLLFLFTNFPYYQNARWVFSLLTIFIYWLSYESLKKPKLFRLIHGMSEINERLPVIPPLIAHRRAVKYNNSGLKQEEVQIISDVLAKRMDVDKLYLDANLTLEKLASALGCQKHKLSQVLNEQYHVSFNEFINQKRTAAARAVLSDINFNHLKIASIAYDSGFNSLSSFNSVFKKLEGVTPSQFRTISQQGHSQIRRV
jgi:AraC-like DNA-binding protein